jgi:hypothetical protein
MERDNLTTLLSDSGEASTACRDALLDGADLIMWNGWAPADRILPAYERREARTIAGGVSTLGFPEALDGLRRAGVRPVQVGQVTATTPPYVFMFFLTEEPALVACVGIGRSDGIGV